MAEQCLHLPDVVATFEQVGCKAVTCCGIRSSAFGVRVSSEDAWLRDLEVWQVSMTLVEEVFAVCRRLPDDQRFGLVSQLQRAAVSVPSNIAEGHAKRSGKDYQRHLRIAAGSLAELETQLELCVRLHFVTRDDVRPAWNSAQRVAQMLSRLTRSVSSRTRRTPNPRAPTNGTWSNSTISL